MCIQVYVIFLKATRVETWAADPKCQYVFICGWDSTISFLSTVTFLTSTKLLSVYLSLYVSSHFPHATWVYLQDLYVSNSSVPAQFSVSGGKGGVKVVLSCLGPDHCRGSVPSNLPLRPCALGRLLPQTSKCCLERNDGAAICRTLLETGSFVFQSARLFMFANVNICKSRCWAPADWGPPEGLEEALFTCSEECCTARTLLYLSGTQGHSAGKRWAALSLSKVSTSQYQQQNTMWATWEKEMEFLLMLLQCSETQVQRAPSTVERRGIRTGSFIWPTWKM